MTSPGRRSILAPASRHPDGARASRFVSPSSDPRRPPMAKRPPSIPDSELDVLKVLWDRGQATVREVLETLRAAGRQWSYATVATLLDRLETKGVVTSDRSELAFVYRPVVSNQEVRQKRVNSLVDKLYRGEPGLLVLHLLKSHPLDARQAKEVRAALAEMTGQVSREKAIQP